MNEGLVCFGVRLIDAPREVVGRICALPVEDAALRVRASCAARHVMVLKTCERFEVYSLEATGNAQRATGVEAMAAALDLPGDALAGHFRFYEGQAAAEHLLRVTAGLESRLVGEPQVLCQVRCAYLSAVESRSLGPVLSALGRAAIRAGRRVRRETALGASRDTLTDRVRAHLCTALEDRALPVIVLVGTGKLAMDVAAVLHGARFGRLRVVSRSAQRAAELAGRCGGSPHALGQLAEALAGADAVVACTSGSACVIAPAMLAPRRGGRIAVIDLGVPHNVDPAVARMPGVTLTTLDDLARARGVCPVDIEQAERIVGEELARFEQWRRARNVVPLIARLLREMPAADERPAPVRRSRLHERIMSLKASAA